MKLKISLSIVTLVLSILGIGFWTGKITIATLVGTIDIPRHTEIESSGVTGEVTVYRDSAGVPHIYGDDSKDVMFAVGYAIAEDRLFQLEVVRRAAMGELAEILGKEMLEADKEARTVAYTEDQLLEIFESMSPFHQAHLQAMVDGINLYVEQMRKDPDSKLPLEFASLDIEPRNYRPQDILAGFSIPVRFYGAAGGRELLNLAFLNELKQRYDEQTAMTIFNDVLVLNDPDAYAFDTPETEVTVTPPSINAPQALAVQSQLEGADNAGMIAKRMLAKQQAYHSVLNAAGLSQGASRSMIIGPEKSANGNVLMMQATADGHEVHISGGGFEVAGMSFAVIGLPVMGRTANFGWLITTAERDTVDIFAEQINPDNKHEYWYQGEWRKMDVRQETINSFRL